MEIRDKIEILDREVNALDKQTNLLTRVLLFWSGIGAGTISYFMSFTNNLLVLAIMLIGIILSLIKVGNILDELRIIYDKIKKNNQIIENLTEELKNG